MLSEVTSPPAAIGTDWCVRFVIFSMLFYLLRLPDDTYPEELPLETLVFTVSDGRVGTISLQGKKVLELQEWSNRDNKTGNQFKSTVTRMGQFWSSELRKSMYFHRVGRNHRAAWRL